MLVYNPELKENSICHPKHVLMEEEEIKKYFPWMYVTKGQISIIYRITSSTSLVDIQKQIQLKRNKYYYFLWTTWKAVRTGKFGWLYWAHPDFTHCGVVEDALKPIIHHYFQHAKGIQAVPKTESKNINGNKIQQCVLALYRSYDDVDKMR